jgi:hypothetical protein
MSKVEERCTALEAVTEVSRRFGVPVSRDDDSPDLKDARAAALAAGCTPLEIQTASYLGHDVFAELEDKLRILEGNHAALILSGASSESRELMMSTWMQAGILFERAREQHRELIAERLSASLPPREPCPSCGCIYGNHECHECSGVIDV